MLIVEACTGLSFCPDLEHTFLNIFNLPDCPELVYLQSMSLLSTPLLVVCVITTNLLDMSRLLVYYYALHLLLYKVCFYSLFRLISRILTFCD